VKVLFEHLTYDSEPPLTKTGEVAKRQPKLSSIRINSTCYTAQFLHYGLKPLKMWEPAKKRLLAAYARGGEVLKVPERILRLEEMKEYWVANELAKEVYADKKSTRGRRGP
jgi:hypothetical protein